MKRYYKQRERNVDSRLNQDTWSSAYIGIVLGVMISFFPLEAIASSGKRCTPYRGSGRREMSRVVVCDK